jgi:DeoR family fructose operon transcriptional repressor
MYPAERQSAIIARGSRSTGSLLVSDLSTHLGVTPETVRRDLSELERQGLVRRRRGGAVLTGRPFELPLARRRDTEAAERRAVAALVVAGLPEEGVLLLDSGSMTLEIAMLLPDASRLIVVTNSLPVAALLAPRPHLTVLSLPGRVRPVTQGTVGDWALRRLGELHADVTVLGANGVGATSGATTTLLDEAELKRGMIQAARRRVLAVTASKFQGDSFCRFAGVSEFDLVVTDGRLDAVTAHALGAAGTEVLVAGGSRPGANDPFSPDHPTPERTTTCPS